jgi:tRNA-2-methylthio-N6-dimethylallyladenosine synthase
MSLTSDIIVGFPGETDQDFRCTMKLVEHCEFDSLYLFKYSKRPGTPAAKLNDDVPESLKKTRFLELEAHHRRIQSRIYKSYLGSTASVLVEAESARSIEDLMGHSTCHKVVNFKGDTNQKGKIVDVLITEAKVNSLYGQQVTPMVLGI